MKKIDSQHQLYMQLASSGDPAAFCALFRDHLNNVYVSLRAKEKDHGEACEIAVKKVLRVYGKFIGRRLNNPQRWIVAKCGLKKFEVKEDANSAADCLADYEKQLNAALQRYYSSRLNDGGKRKIRKKKPRFALALGLLAATGVFVFLFLAESVIFISFDRFSREYRISFPKLREDIWRSSGLIRSAIDTGAVTGWPPQTNAESTNNHE